MRHLTNVVLLLAMCNFVAYGMPVFAQDAPKAQIFAGYSYGNYELIPGSSSTVVGSTKISGAPSARLGLSGWNAAIAVNMNRWFSFATDFSGYYSASVSTSRMQTSICRVGPNGTTNCSTTIVNTVSRPKIHNFLFGPQFSYPAGKIRPFAQFLVGGEHVDLGSSLQQAGLSGIGIEPPAFPGHVGNTGFAMALGGGVDCSIKSSLAWRFQAGYLTSQAGALAPNHVRISTGLVWRVGN